LIFLNRYVKIILMRLYYFTPLPGLALSTQYEMAEAKAGWIGSNPTWADSAKSFPTERGKMLKALRAGAGDEVWVAALPVLAANKSDMRHVVSALVALGASVIDGHSGWTSPAPHEGMMWANCWDVYAKSRKLLDPPVVDGLAAQNGSKPRRMPDAEARPIWFDPTLPSNAEAIDKMNADPRYRLPWTVPTAYRLFGRAGRPPGTRPKPPQPKTNE
jgi:hypothetical protein